jgi:hypothetical protein
VRRDGRHEHDRGRMPVLGLVFCGLAMLAALFGCGHVPPMPPPAPMPPGGATCATACARGRALGCDWAKATPSGVECDAVCTIFEASGTLSYGVECVTNARTCEDAEPCGGAK